MLLVLIVSAVKAEQKRWLEPEVRDGVDQRLERGAPVGPGKEELGVRRDAEWGFAESEVLEIHHCPLAKDSMRL